MLSGTVGSWVEDPIYDYTNSSYGVNGYVNTLTQFGGYLWAGGNFGSINGSSNPAGNAMRIQNQSGSGGSQTYDNDGGNMSFNAEVNCSCASASYVFFGGSFTTVQGGSTTANYFIAYTGTSFQTCDNNNFNSIVNACAVSQLSNEILVGGNFNQGGFQNVCYINASNPNASTNAGVGSAASIQKNCINIFPFSGRDMFCAGDSTTYTSASFTNWDNLGSALGTSTPSGCYLEPPNTPNVSFFTNGFVRRNTAVSQLASFSLPTANFRTIGGFFQTASLSTPGQAQQFVSDSNGTVWYAVGNPVCSFS